MNKNRYIAISALFFLFSIFGTQTITSCKKIEAEVFNGKNALYFPNEEKKNSLNFSFSHYPGIDKVTAKFEMALIGNFLKEDKEYKIKVVDSLTTADKSEYKLLTSKFKAGSEKDTLMIELTNTPRLETQEVKVVFAIEENENFNIGYFNKLTVEVTFNAIQSQPAWWNDDIIDTYLGDFSIEKLSTFITATGLTTLEGMESWEMRKQCLIVKDYIAKENITEKDGSPMVIPCF
ncbi:MAG: DUF4843 domain-containing protein [Rikenellaceae bacterium]